MGSIGIASSQWTNRLALFASLMTLLGFATGCSTTAPPALETPSMESPSHASVRTPDRLPAPVFDRRNSLKMVRAGNTVQVGDSIEDALAAFKPDRNGYKVAEMPPGWKDDRFKCDGWETGTTGFGAITFEDRVVVAVYHEERVSEDRLREVMESYEAVIPGSATQLTGSRVRYWFWEDGTQRLMICAVQPPNEGLSLTIALGESATMNYLGMNPSLAEKDRELAESIFQQGLERKQSARD